MANENPEEESYALDDSGLSARQTMAHVYIAFSALFIALIPLFSALYTNYFFIFFLFLLSPYTVLSVPCLILAFGFASTQSLDFIWKSTLSSIVLIALFYTLVAYGLLKKKRVASAAAFISSLLTIFADIGFSYFFWSSITPEWSGLFVLVLCWFMSGMVFNIFLVLILRDIN